MIFVISIRPKKTVEDKNILNFAFYNNFTVSLLYFEWKLCIVIEINVDRWSLITAYSCNLIEPSQKQSGTDSSNGFGGLAE